MIPSHFGGRKMFEELVNGYIQSMAKNQTLAILNSVKSDRPFKCKVTSLQAFLI